MGNVTDRDGKEVDIKTLLEHPVSQFYINMKGEAINYTSNLIELLSFHRIDYHYLTLKKQYEITMRIAYSRTGLSYPFDTPVSDSEEMVACGDGGCRYPNGQKVPDIVLRVRRASHRLPELSR